MIQLRYLEDCELFFATSIKAPNGRKIDSYESVGKYKVQVQEINDQVSASIYGANINRMYRICSPKRELEVYLDLKVGKSQDNISKYTLVIDGDRYRISAVKNHWIDIELMNQ